MIAAVSVAMTVVIMGSYWTKASLSRLWIGYAWVLSLLLVFVGRRIWHAALDRRRADGRLAFRTLVVGSAAGRSTSRTSIRSQPVGYDLLGFVSADGRLPHVDGVPILGT